MSFCSATLAFPESSKCIASLTASLTSELADSGVRWLRSSKAASIIFFIILSLKKGRIISFTLLLKLFNVRDGGCDDAHKLPLNH